ncbi:hypothetical protein V2J09_007411 [Rumex salicifolius]
MASGLDMSLDDLIKNSKTSSSRGGSRGGRGRSGPGPARRFPDRAPNRSAPYAMPKIQPTDLAWGHDMFVDQPVRAPAIETGTKLYVSNLEYGVSNEDIKGTAEIVFARRVDAVAAVKRYNDVQLDGKPMKIELIGANIPAPGLLATPAAGAFRNFNPAPPRIGQGRGGGIGRPRGGRGGFGRRGGGGGGRGRGPSVDNNEKVSAQDLDAELEKYHAEAMQLT